MNLLTKIFQVIKVIHAKCMYMGSQAQSKGVFFPVSMTSSYSCSYDTTTDVIQGVR